MSDSIGPVLYLFPPSRESLSKLSVYSHHHFWYIFSYIFLMVPLICYVFHTSKDTDYHSYCCLTFVSLCLLQALPHFVCWGGTVTLIYHWSSALAQRWDSSRFDSSVFFDHGANSMKGIQKLAPCCPQTDTSRERAGGESCGAGRLPRGGGTKSQPGGSGQ